VIVCTSCGYENEDTDAFCGSCAGFLEWEGQKVQAPEPEPVPEPEPRVDTERQGLVERVKEKIGLGEDTPTPDGAPASEQVPAPPAPLAERASAPPVVAPPVVAPPVVAPPVVAPPVVAPPVVAPPVVAPPVVAPPVVAPPVAPGPSAPAGATQPAAATTATQPTAVAPVQPAAVKPAAVKVRPSVKKAAPTRVINPGDKICGQCGEGNDPARHFCRRCGESLEEAVVFALPWYKRVWRKLTQRNQHSAGDRPRQRRRAVGGSGRGWLTSLVMVLIALVIVVFVVLAFAGPGKKHIRHDLSAWYHDVVNAVHTTYNPVHPTSALASSAAAGHPASNLIDDASNTSWQADRAGVGQIVRIGLAGPTNINKIGFLIGDTDAPQDYVTEPRPHKILVVFNGTKPSSQIITFKDTDAFQTFTVDASKATALSIKIESVFPSDGAGKSVSITEVELYTKSH